MIQLQSALASIIAAVSAEFEPQGIKDIKDHPGEFTEDELRRFVIGETAIRVAILDVTEVQTDGRGSRAALVTVGLFVIATDRNNDERNTQALETVSRVIEWLGFNQFDDDRLMPADPKTVSAENLYSGELDKSAGVAFWGIRWQQRIKATH